MQFLEYTKFLNFLSISRASPIAIRMFDRSVPRSKDSRNIKTRSDRCNSTVTWSRLCDRTYPFRSYRELYRDTSDMFDIFAWIRESVDSHSWSLSARDFVAVHNFFIFPSPHKENAVSHRGMIISSPFRASLKLSAARVAEIEGKYRNISKCIPIWRQMYATKATKVYLCVLFVAPECTYAPADAVTALRYVLLRSRRNAIRRSSSSRERMSHLEYASCWGFDEESSRMIVAIAR